MDIRFTIVLVIGKCTKCGECCGSVLPITQEDADRIQEYVFENDIKPQKYMLVMQNRLSCPYYTGNKEIDKEKRKNGANKKARKTIK